MRQNILPLSLKPNLRLRPARLHFSCARVCKTILDFIFSFLFRFYDLSVALKTKKSALPAFTTRPKIAIIFWEIVPHPEVTRDFEKLENQFLFLQDFFLLLQCESFEVGCRKRSAETLIKSWFVPLTSQCILRILDYQNKMSPACICCTCETWIITTRSRTLRSLDTKAIILASQIIQCNGFQILSQLLINVSFS